MKTRELLIIFVVSLMVCLAVKTALANKSTDPKTISYNSALAAPTLTVTTSGTTASLSWTSIAGATGYTLYYIPYPYTGSGTIQNIDTATQTGCSFDLWEGAAFYVAVKAYDSVESSGYSNIELFTIDSSQSNWAFTSDSVDFGIEGVSPEAVLLDDGSVRLYVTGGVEGMKLYQASDGLTFTRETASLPLGGADPTLIRLDDGTYRMYYNDRDTIKTATSPDGLTWTEESSTGISNTNGNMAWGVPDSIELPDGRIRLYWVDTSINVTPPNGYEVVRSAISPDGLTFTDESGYRTEDTNGQGGWVDPHVLLAEEGNWICLCAFIPPLIEGGGAQEPITIHVGTSTDGLTWSFESEPVISVSGGHVGDPASYPLGNGTYRVYFLATSELNPPHTSFIRSGVLTPTPE